MAPTLYYSEPSCPSRAALLTAKLVCGSNVVLKHLNLLAKEHLTPEFLKVYGGLVDEIVGLGGLGITC